MKLETTSDAFDAKGVTTNATKNALIPVDFANSFTDPTIGSAKIVTMPMRPHVIPMPVPDCA
eukprot:2740057-Rhodomonas_salina.2